MKRNERKTEGNNIRRNNGGLTLVELLVSIAVLLVVSTAIFAFMLTGSRFFNRHSAEADMQAEAQIMKNYLDDLIRDTGKGLTYYKDGYKNADRCLAIYGEETIAFLGWIQSEEAMHYLEKGKDSIVQEGDQYIISFTEAENNAANWPVLSEYMTDFTVSLSKLTEEHQLFTCDMAFSLRQRDMQTAHTITLRNQVVNQESLEEIYEDLGENKNKILGITLKPELMDIRKGGTVQYQSDIVGTGIVSQDVVYEVMGNQSAGTTISQSGLLTVGADEEAELLTVTATAAADPEISVSAIVNITRVVEVTIVAKTEPQYEGTYVPGPDSPIKLCAEVEGDFLAEDAKKVVWSVEEKETEIPMNKFTLQTDGSYCTVTVADDEELYGKTLVIKAVSTLDPSKSDTHRITIANIPDGELVISAPEFKIKRGGTLDLDAKVIGETTDDSEYHWEIVDYNGLGSGNLTMDGNGVLTVDKNIEYNKEFAFTIKVTWKKEGHAQKEKSCVVTMDKVALSFVPSYAVLIVPGNGVAEEIRIQLDGIVPEATELKKSGNTAVNSIVRGDRLFLSLNQGEEPKREFLELTFSISPETPGARPIQQKINIYFYPWNLILNGTLRYAPVPGDRFLSDTEKPGIPDTDKEIEMDGKTYGYKFVTVQGITYEYLVDKSPNPTTPWFMRVQGEKYTYNDTKQTYEK